MGNFNLNFIKRFLNKQQKNGNVFRCFSSFFCLSQTLKTQLATLLLLFAVLQINNLLLQEILDLCELIYEHGYEGEDKKSVMLFGDLFKVYTRISDKVVGILLRARKYGLVHFEPEILFQGQDDSEPVHLLKSMSEIYDIYNAHKSFSIVTSSNKN